MRIVTWNMAAGFGYHASRHERAWGYLRELDPDVALLQEAFPPAWVHDHWSIVAHRRYAPINGRADVPWGSAIVARKGTLIDYFPDETTPWLGELRGAVAIAKLDYQGPWWVASIHSNAYPVSADRLTVFPTDDLRRCDVAGVWEIEPMAMEFERLVGNQRFLAGGDLYSALLFDTTYGQQSSAKLFANLRESGFHDLRLTEHEQQTYFKEGKGPYQLDHVYADAITASSPHTWRVLPEPARDLDLSDHAPIEVVFAFRNGGPEQHRFLGSRGNAIQRVL